MRDSDTIVALSSGALPSGVAVLRMSGPEVRNIVGVVAGPLPPPRHLTLRPIGGDTVIDRGLIAFFPAPHSFTGEDCAELQVHGSPAGVRALLRLLVLKGCRLAEAGEFTRRAFINGKLDLTAVEGLGDLLGAETENQRRQALQRLEGGLTQQINSWRLSLLDLRAEVEARLDFADEGDVDAELPETFKLQLDALSQSFDAALEGLEGGRLVREGIRVALAGPPNVGKSSLLNALAKSDIAIVTDEAGTTRDVREVPLDIDGQLFILLDLAGLRDTESKAEAEGIRRAYEAIRGADILLWLRAPDVADIPMLPFDGPTITLGGKADLAPWTNDVLPISAKTGHGLDTLVERLKNLAGQLGTGEPSLLSRERDRAALQQAKDALSKAATHLDSLDMCAEDLRQASFALERLLGRMDAEHVLDRLFTAFCIGK